MRKLLLTILVCLGLGITSQAEAAFPSPFANYSYCQKWTMTAGGESGGAATTTTTGFALWATTTVASLKTTTFGGHILAYNQASSTPIDLIFGSGTDCNTNAGSALNPIWDTYSSTTGEVAVGVVAPNISSTSPKTILVYYGYGSDTNHLGTFNDLGIKGFWPFGTSTTYWTNLKTFDQTANKNTGTIVTSHASTFSTQGQIGKAFSFNGSGDNVNAGNDSSMQITTKGTLAAWVKAGSSQNTWPGIVCDSDIDTDFNGYCLYMGSGGNLAIELDDAAGSYDAIQSPSTYNDNQWHFAVATWDGSTVTIYVDGVPVNSAAESVIPAPGTYNLHIGSTGNESFFFNGLIDDARVYGRALSAMDIKTIYNNTVNSARFWTFGTEETPTGSSPVTLPWFISSTNFFLHPAPLSIAGGNSTYSFSTSTTFKLAGAGGEMAVGTSTSADYGLSSGFIRNLYHTPVPVYEQTHYHWRNDDGSESGATSGTSGNQDTATTTIAKGKFKRLRVEVANHGGTLRGYSPQSFGLQYAILSGSCSATPSSVWNNVGPVGSSAADWVMVDSANLTAGADTTNISLSAGGVGDSNHTFLSPNGGVVDGSNTTTAAISVPSDSFIELEYAIEASTAATGGGSYCFRTDNASSTSNFSYTTYPQATLNAGTASLTVLLDANSETFPALTPGILVSTSTIIYVSTNNSSGFNVKAARNNSTATLLLTGNPSISISDNTAWSPGVDCATAGNAISSSTNPNTLQFRVNKAGTDTGNFCSAWWGADDTETNARFAGFPLTSQMIVNRVTASTPTTTTRILYDLNTSSLQQTGAYTGSITYTITTNL